MGVKQWIAAQGAKAGNRITKLSSLSPAQMEQIIDLRDQYFGDMAAHDPSYEAERLTRGLLAASSVEIFSAYLSQLQELYTPVDKNASLRVVKEKNSELIETFPNFEKEHNIRFINISKWVTDKRENSLEKLVNVYAVLSDEQCNIALIFHRSQSDTQVYLAVVNTKNAKNNSEVDDYIKRLTDAVRGNFPGSVFSASPSTGTPQCLSNLEKRSVAIASNIPTEKSEKFISQTIEKLLDGIVPQEKTEEYTLILLATPIRDVETRKLRLAELYSGLAPYSEWQTNFTYTEQMARGSSATFGVNIGASAGIQNGQNQAIQTGVADQKSQADSKTDQKGNQVSQNDAVNVNQTNGFQESAGSSQTNTHTTSNGEVYNTTLTDSHSTTDTIGGSVSDSFGGSVSAGVSGDLGPVEAHADISVDYHHTVGHSNSHGSTNGIAQAVSQGINSSVSNAASNAVSHTLTQVASQTIGHTIGNTVGSSTSTAVAKTLGRAVTNSLSKTAGVFQSFNLGGNVGANFARSSSVTATIGKGEGITQSFTNYTVKHALELLTQQMERFEQSSALGMWDFAAYVISQDVNIANNVAHAYLALTEGETSYLSRSAVNIWRGDIDENGAAKTICEYLQELRHPEFVLDPNMLLADFAFFTYPPYVTATTSLSGKELAYSLNFPNRSISGLPVFECAEFGRNIATYDLTAKNSELLRLGQIFHMNHTENLPVHLMRDSLTSHTFITGSTGSGKSNTVYQILQEAIESGSHFMVIEPAKGEYKTVFGGEANVFVYGTNPRKTPLLRLNPFSFPDDIHVLEHIDRLVEIFNVCWPMYAAMPAVLKNAIEQSYVDCGWDLTESENPFGNHLYPSFGDVARNVKTIIDSSEYDTENKGAYKGSLLTRLQSLTNGINGVIFRRDELTPEELFDTNVIIDLSRVGSAETKSLFMGILVLKLQEYRMSHEQMIAELKHITVLEEAHHLLKRTSTEQPTEGGNLLGKSVEMIANAIAEMRTYGEGFIIADQAPSLLDMSVIRNTNTKIILRLPDQTDRELVGKAAGLNDDQIGELAKLPRGVAAVYQNEWIQPVLCKVDHFKAESNTYSYQLVKTVASQDYSDQIQIAKLLCKGTKIQTEMLLKEIAPKLEKMKLSSYVRVCILKSLQSPPLEPRMTKLAPIISELFPAIRNAVANAYSESRLPTEWTHRAEQALVLLIGRELEDQVRRDIVQAVITDYIFNERNSITDLERWHTEGGLH